MPAVAPPDPETLRAELLRPGGLWTHIDYVSETGSTNADLARLARSGAEPGRVLLTANQTAGRGRFTRAWTTPPGVSIALSILVRPRRPLAEWTWLPLLAGLSVADGLTACTGLGVELKWPNDVLIGGKKVCGLLSEVVDTRGGECAVIGWGINVAMDTAELPVQTATSLLLEGERVPMTEVAAAVLDSFAEHFGTWDAGERERVVAAYARHCTTIGKRVRVVLSETESIQGHADGVDESGRLLVDGRAYAAGDVFHLR